MNPEPYLLVIDDENHICESCDRIFSNAGYKVDTNINATNGFRQALMNAYDAIILDLNLVESDGMQILCGIRKRKPDVPVVIITGYPSEESRRQSTTLGVTDYITKPFEPSEILESVQKVMSTKIKFVPEDKTVVEEVMAEPAYHYHLSSWFYKQPNGLLRVGGYLTNLSDNSIESVKLPDTGGLIYRGLPLAEVTLSNGTKQNIPSSVSGTITLVNNQLREHPIILERNLHKKSWIAVVEPNRLEEDLGIGNTRSILVLSDTDNEENEFFKQFVHKGCITKITGKIDKVSEILAEGSTQVLALDARNLAVKGPEYVQRINLEFPDVKIIVFNEPNVKNEKQYRENNIFYYGVNPIANNEMVDLLHCAFSGDKKKTILKNPHVNRFLPDTISKISITNRFGTKVTLFAYNDVLKNNSGLGYLLTKDLLDMAFPLEISHSRYRKSVDDATEIQDITKEKEKNDRIIILQTRDTDRIPGSISKEIQEYKNRNTSVNLLINIFIQPASGEDKEVEFDENTTIALRDIVKSEMISK
ncbi:MAG: response regulator [Bacteroidales bacterium]|nr:MAG: response regulator [Bacteroidales bacterium]